jgi:hypothetical protein
MNRTTCLAAAMPLGAGLLLSGCPRPVVEHAAHLHVLCTPANGAPATFDENSIPPEHGQSCAPGSQLTFTYDNEGGYGYLTVFAVTRDDIVFYFPNSKEGESIAINPSGTNVPLPDAFSVPNKTRDIMALFSKVPLKAKDVDSRTRSVTLADLGGTEVRVRLSAEVGPVD